MGKYESLEALKEAVTQPEAGDGYSVGTSAPYDIYIYDGVTSDWTNHGKLQGAKGEKGEQGEPGTPGAKGERGDPGAKGEPGDKGADGFSPTVQTAPAEDGTTVTITDHEGAKVFTIKNGAKGDKGERGERGEPGAKGDTGARGETGPAGTPGEKGEQGEPGQVGAKGERGEPGAPGKDGTPGEKGDAGEPGKSAYQAALDGGFVGEESTFNTSLGSVGSKITAPETAEDGQVLTYRTDHWTAETPKEAGVSSFNGRTGAIQPQEGDYTAAQVGARPDTWTPTASEVGAIPTVIGAQGQFLGFTSANLVGAVDAPQSTSKRTARFVVGTSTAGWTAADCDYLCDGTDDQVEINAAIQALPAGGGEVVILDGTYNITASIGVNKGHTKLRGNGSVTVLKAMKSNVIIINITKGYCTIADLMCDGNKASFSGAYGIYIASSSNTITGNTCNNSSSYGIYINNGSSNIITGNTCSDNDDSIYINNGSNTITGNTCSDSGNYGIYINSGSNTITGNTCSDGNIGIYISGSSNTATGNTCGYTNNYGIYIDDSSNTITGNTCNSSKMGIRINSDRNTATGNTCNNNDDGIYIRGSSNTITGNTCIRGTGTSGDYTSSQYTIEVNDRDNLVVGNNCMGKAPVDNGTNNTIVYNKY